MDFSFLFEETQFQAFGLFHIVPVITILLFGIILTVLTKNRTSDKKWRVLFVLSFFPSIGYLWPLFTVLYDGSFSVKEDLPLHICRFTALMLPLVVFTKNRTLLGVFYFWITAGTFNAVVTPDIDFGFPHWSYWSYWILHAGLLIIPMFYVFNLEIKINRRDLKNAFWLANLYLIFSFACNYVFDSNYMYSMHKPPSASILDYLGEWPIYLISVQLIGLLMFIVVYLPFELTSRSRSV